MFYSVFSVLCFCNNAGLFTLASVVGVLSQAAVFEGVLEGRQIPFYKEKQIITKEGL